MDHCEKQKRKPNPRETANLLSKYTFFYTGKIFRKAFKNDLEEKDLYEVLHGCESKKCGDKLEMEWKRQKSDNKKPTVFSLLRSCFGYRYSLLILIDIIWNLVRCVLEPYAMSNFISYFTKKESHLTKDDAYFFAGIVMGLNVFHTFYMHNWILAMHTMAIQMRTAFSSFIYRKSLKLTPSAIAEISFGNIATLITKDVSTFQTSLWMVNEMYVAIAQSFVMCYLLYNQIGYSAFVGIGIMISLMPLQMFIGRFINKLRLKIGKKTDERLQITQEVLSAIRIIKMYTWEAFFVKEVNKARRKEVNSTLKVFYLRVIIIILGILCSKVAFYALISVYLWLGNQIDAKLLFYIVTCSKKLQHFLGFHIPLGMARFAELYAAASRISKVLYAEELGKLDGTNEITIKPKIELKAVDVKIKDKEILKDITFSISSGLTLVTGVVGSGKSALLKAVVQDYPRENGHLVTHGRISYSSQDPWLFPSSVKQNITFKEKFDATRYNEVIRVCALRYDFDLLDHGDETIVSDKGINLSKGQQARINLARAVYKDSEIYLLDDALTALDAHVQDYIFNECIKGFLKDKLVVLVTQNITQLLEADNVVVLKNGCIKSFGKPTKNIVSEIEQIIGKDDDLEKENVDDTQEKLENNIENDGEETKLIEAEQIIKKQVYHEEKKKGNVNFSIYHKYVKYGGGYIIFILIVVIYFVAQYTDSYSEKLLSRWVDYLPVYTNCTINHINNTECFNNNDNYHSVFNLFTIMLGLSVLLALIRSYAMYNFARVASINVHKAMTNRIINAVMHFFDSHFIGNIINRFSQDLYNIDEQLPLVLQECLRVTFSVGGIILLLVIVNWTFLLASMVFFVILILMRICYMPTGRSLKRLEAATRSPLLGHLNSSLEGLTTIRAYKAQDTLREEFDRHQDLFTSAHYTLTCTMRAFGFSMDALCSIFIFTVVSRFLFFDSNETAGNVGLALTQVFMLAGHVQWGVRQWAELENQMTSVERVIEYTEITLEKKSGQVVKNWPNKGSVIYDNVSLTYHNTHEKVLKNINLTVEAKQKIGIVGRTGAGKSSIISTLFRLYNIEGTIYIDSVDTKTLSLDFLRQSIAIIPQDPVLFTGTMRNNIDPINKYTDTEIWEAIGKVKIKDLVPSLDFVIDEGGANFSSGQKQLICLARAIIRKNKIVVLDEATANMDPETDALLHNTIKENFSDCTVFIIAHRLHSIIECDKVLVLDRGVVSEFDNPDILLQNKNGIFYKMVEQSGLLNK